MKAWTAVLVGLLVGVVGCARPNAPEAAAPTPEVRLESAGYSVEMTGDLQARFRGEVPMRFLTFTTDDPHFEGLQVLSVMPQDLVPVGENGGLKVAFDVVGYQGNGTYEIPAGIAAERGASAPDGGPVSGAALSGVLVEWHPADGPPLTIRRTHEPCRVEVRDNGFQGQLECAAVGEEGGPRFSVRMAWG